MEIDKVPERVAVFEKLKRAPRIFPGANGGREEHIYNLSMESISETG